MCSSQGVQAGRASTMARSRVSQGRGARTRIQDGCHLRQVLVIAGTACDCHGQTLGGRSNLNRARHAMETRAMPKTLHVCWFSMVCRYKRKGVPGPHDAEASTKVDREASNNRHEATHRGRRPGRPPSVEQQQHHGHWQASVSRRGTPWRRKEPMEDCTTRRPSCCLLVRSYTRVHATADRRAITLEYARLFEYQ